jgi:hypothetical protein
MVLIGLVGKKQVGKDTVAMYLKKRYQFINHAFADPLKEACQVLFMLNESQLNDNRLKERTDPRWDKTPRQMMQLVGTDLFRNHVDKDFWIKHMEFWIEMHPEESIIISDVRFQNEADLIKERGGYLWKIDRTTAFSDHHESENQQIKGIDFNIYNETSLDDLYQEIDRLMSILFPPKSFKR